MTAKSKKQIAVAQAPTVNGGFSLISDVKLLQLYATMLKCRVLGKRVLEERQRKQGTTVGDGHTALGQEAAQVGVAVDLREEDTIFFSRCDFALNFIKNQEDTKNLGFDQCVAPQLFAHAFSVNLAEFATTVAQLYTAAGLALANKTKKNDRIVVVFLDAASASTASGPKAGADSWQDALFAAGAHQLPMIFVCTNGLAAESMSGTPADEDFPAMSSGFFGEEIAAKAELCGFPAIAVDGNDVVAVYRVATESIARARRGGGPTLITCKICTESKPGALRGHSGADPVNSHTREAAELWKAGDPIHKMELYLTQKGLFREEWKREIVAAFSRELNAAIEATQKLASS